MTESGTPKFEFPTDMRKVTEQSLEQVKTAINAYLQFFKSNVPENAMGGSALVRTPGAAARMRKRRPIAAATGQ